MIRLRTSSAFALVLGTLLLGPNTPVAADVATGTWTGEVRLQGNYYWESSTRVMAPEVRARLSSPDGTDVNAQYLVDAITSASQAAGVQEDIRFTETRHQGTLGIGHEFDLGDAQLRLDLNGRVSREPDYLASGISLAGGLSLAQRCTLLGWSLTYIHDNVGSVIRGRTMGGSLSNRGRVGQLEGFTLGLSASQILTPTMIVSGGYDLVHNYGYLQNPYRQVLDVGRPEEHPDQRTRHSLYGRFAWYIPESRSAIHLMYRFYIDDWDLAGSTPEVRLYQEVGDLVTLRLRYRFYGQSDSYFWQPMYDRDDIFVTADPKMSRFHSHLFGLHSRLSLRFLEGSWLEFLAQGEFWMSFEYWFQTSRFGNGVIAQSAIAIPF